MDISREDAQKRMTQDPDLKNYQLQWKTEKGGGSVSWKTEQARPDDDDDEYFLMDINHCYFAPSRFI